MTTVRAGKWGSLEPRTAGIILGTLIALKIAILFAFAWSIRFIMDEFGWLGSAKYLGNGYFDTVWPAKSVLYAVFFKIAHVIGWDATSIVLIGRLQTALLACITLALVYACARTLGESRVRALTILVILLSFTNMMERMFRTIAEPVALFFAVAALLVVIRGNADRARTLLVAGLLSGCAFLTTQKSVYFNLAMGLALVGDAAIAGNYRAAFRRGILLVAGWLAAIVVYCLVFGGLDPLPVAKSLVFGPVEVASRGGREYGGLRRYVLQTLLQNPILYLLCFGGMLLELARIRKVEQRHRLALIFTLVITALVFAHDQPWPYVFIMALPFMALWALVPLDRIAGNARLAWVAWAAVAVTVINSYLDNIRYFKRDNTEQLVVMARAEHLLAPNEVYFDGVGMLPNRPEPSTLWLDKFYSMRTIREGAHSEAYRIFADTPPKIIIWSYRMDLIKPVVGPLIRESYVKTAPNIRLAGRDLQRDQATSFNVPIAGRYRLYDQDGAPVDAALTVNGKPAEQPVTLVRGRAIVTLARGPDRARLLPEGSYAGQFHAGPDSRLYWDSYN